MLLLLFVGVGSSRRNPQNENRLLYVHLYATCRLGKCCCCGDDQFARLVHRGVDGAPRVKVQHV